MNVFHDCHFIFYFYLTTELKKQSINVLFKERIQQKKSLNNQIKVGQILKDKRKVRQTIGFAKSFTNCEKLFTF